MTTSSVRLALGGLLAMAAAMGIGRFVYTPILPAMISGLGWSKADAGLIASANFVGYLAGALAAGLGLFARAPRRWLAVALATSAATTAAMALTTSMPLLAVLRFWGGAASAFVIVCSSTLILGRLAVAGRSGLAGVHFAGVGTGISVSAAACALLAAHGTGWQGLWIAAGAIAAVMGGAALLLIPAEPPVAASASAATAGADAGARPGLVHAIVAYGLFGFGYVITATFIVAMVRESPDVRWFEPWIWVVFGLAAVPSVPLWTGLGARIGALNAFAIAAVVEALGVAASVEWPTLAGAVLAAVLLGGTFMGLTALGLIAGRALSGGKPQRAIGLMSAAFGTGQMIGPALAGFLAERTGSLRAASLVASAALMVASMLAARAARAR